MLEFDADLFDAVLFDMDGTLTDNARFHGAAWLEFLKIKFGYDLEPSDHRIHGGKTKWILEAILQREFTESAALELHLEKEALYRELAAGQIEAIAGLPQYLEWLRVAGKRVALVTSADALNTAFVLGALGLEEAFSVCVLGSDVQRGKPDPQPFALGSRLVGIAPERCLSHEDSIAGVQSARAARTLVCGVESWLSADALLEAGATLTTPDYAAWLERLE